MKTSVIEVRDMLSVLSVQGVEERIRGVPGVESATANFAAASATVRYDETRLTIADIRSAVRQSGYEANASPATSPGTGHEGHATSGRPPANAAQVPAKTSQGPTAPGGTAQPDKATSGAAPPSTPEPSPGVSAAAPSAKPAAPASAPDAAAKGDKAAQVRN